MINFLVGCVFAVVGMTVLNGISDMLAILIELFKSAMGVKIVKYNATIEQLQKQHDEQDQDLRLIGFRTDADEEDEDDECDSRY